MSSNITRNGQSWGPADGPDGKAENSAAQRIMDDARAGKCPEMVPVGPVAEAFRKSIKDEILAELRAAPVGGDGGSAFPVRVGERQVGQHETEFDVLPGMSLRDHIACQALVGIGTWLPNLPGEAPWFANREEVLKRRAEWAYAQADAMLVARKGGAA